MYMMTVENPNSYCEIMKKYMNTPNLDMWSRVSSVQYFKESEDIADINIIVPNKVVEITFGDAKKEKMTLHPDDTFDLRKCLFIAIAKHKYKREYTQSGIEWKAFELQHLKKYVKIVDSALKQFDKKEKETAK